MDTDYNESFEQYCTTQSSYFIRHTKQNDSDDKPLTLVAMTQPIVRGRPTVPNAEQELAYAARVSSSLQGKTNLGADMKLLASCLKRGEMSVFQTVCFAVEFRTSREVFRQFMRHWSIHVTDMLDVQELSQRYSKINIKNDDKTCVNFYVKSFRFQVQNNRQSSFTPSLEDIDLTCSDIQSKTKDIEIVVPEKSKDVSFTTLNQGYSLAQLHTFRECYNTYEYYLSCGLARESARTFLPEGMTVTDVYANATIRSWITYINTRLHMETGTPQFEHIQLATAIDLEFKKKFPNLHKALWPPKE